MIKLLEIALLIIPVTLWSLWNDRNGDEHKTSNDIFWECVFMFGCSEIVVLIEGQHIAFKALLVSITGFGLIFPYSFNWMWYDKTLGYHKFKYIIKFNFILTHLSETAIPDKYFIKYNVHWLVRLLLYVTLFVLSLIWFL